MTEPGQSGYLAYARQALVTAKGNLVSGDFVASVNRSYYAIFYAANALLEVEGLQRSKHSGVLAAFRERFIKTGRIEEEYSDIYGQAFDTRIESDYDVKEWPTEETATRMLESATAFVTRVERELSNR